MKKLLILILVLTSVVTAHSQNNTFRPGYYIDNDDKKIEGLISYAYDYRVNFKFKKDEEARVEKISPNEASSFVIGKDSFTVIKGFDIEGVGGSLLTIRDKDFVQVIKTGTMKLYLDYSSQGNPGFNGFGGTPFSLHTYIIQKGNEPRITVRHRNRKKFKEQLAVIFNDDNQILKNIEDDVYR